jgi:hypothetical protein
MRKLLQATGIALMLTTSTVAFADEAPFDPMTESEAVLGEQARSEMSEQARARSELLRELDYILGSQDEDEAVLGEQVRAGGAAASDALVEAVRARTELLGELNRVSGAE